MPVSIVDVAKAANVSRMTVTRVMRGDAVAPATRDRVVTTMAQLGYIPSPAARAMRSRDVLRAHQATGLALIFAPDTQQADAFFCEIARGVEQQAADNQLSVMQIHWAGTLADSWPRMQSVLCRKGICGAILAGQFDALEIDAIRQATGQAVLIDAPPPADMPIGSVAADNLQGCEMALRHLQDRGCRRIVMVAGPRQHYFTQAMMQAASHCRSGFENLITLHTDYSHGDAAEAVDRLLESGHRFDGLFGNDGCCIGAMRAMRQHGLRVPQDVRVIGFDDTPVCPYFNPALSSIAIDKRRMGEQAVRCLTQLIREEASAHNLRTIISARLMVRDSS